jgi:glycosyltransferase involved in cell wall biosynthesis
MTTPLKILQVMAGNKHGGAETAYIDMCIAMHESGQIIEAVTRPNDVRIPRLKQAGITVHLLPFGGKIDIFTPWAIQKIIRQFKPDIIQSWMSRAPSKIRRWTPSMNSPRYLHIGRLGTPYKLKYFQSCDAFVAITPDIANYIIQNGKSADHVKHVNNFADTEPVQTPIPRSHYNTPENATLLLGLGRLHSDKAFDTLIKAVKQLPDHIHCWIAGEGPLRGELEQLITDLDLEDRVKLLGWQTDRAALFQAADICTFISRDEGFGTVFVQSWAHETPVIASLADGPRQFIRDGEDGLLIPIDDIDSLCKSILKLDADKQLCEALVKNGKSRYQQEFTKEKTIAGYLDFYRELLAKNNR